MAIDLKRSVKAIKEDIPGASLVEIRDALLREVERPGNSRKTLIKALEAELDGRLDEAVADDEVVVSTHTDFLSGETTALLVSAPGEATVDLTDVLVEESVTAPAPEPVETSTPSHSKPRFGVPSVR